MQPSAEVASLLEALGEPALLVRPGAIVLHANRPAKALGFVELIGQPTSSLAKDGHEDAFEAYLRRCAGSTSPLVGALVLRSIDGECRFQSRGSRVSLGGATSILLRLGRADETRFRALTQKVAELDAEVKERRRAQAILAETLSERELLLRELQHRVKNNMHMLAGMLAGAEREATGEEAKSALRDASLRFSAVSAVQQLLYSSSDLEEIDSEALTSTLIHAAAMTSQAEINVEVDGFRIPIESAVSIALILNELITNAIKHGKPTCGKQQLQIEFKCASNMIGLAVRDNGPGFAVQDCVKRASGIGLVRGLLRQLSGSLSVAQDGGAVCNATFPLPRTRRSARA